MPNCSSGPTAVEPGAGGAGVQRGDRVAIVLPQRFETAVAYMAVLQMGAVAMPLSMLFGPEALEYRLQDSEAVVAICDGQAIASPNAVRCGRIARCCASVIRVGGRSQADRNPIYGGAGAAAGIVHCPATGADDRRPC
jgi:acetyl-CoA synthetase